MSRLILVFTVCKRMSYFPPCPKLPDFTLLTDCGVLQLPCDGPVHVDITGTMYGDEATFSCDNGFTVAGQNTSECQANGEWSGNIPYCVPETCTTCKFSLPTMEKRQSKTLLTIDERGSYWLETVLLIAICR